jgi:hypothetical protein
MASNQSYPTVTSVAGSEFVEIIPASNSGAGPTHVYATANQIAFTQNNTASVTAVAGAATANVFKFIVTSEALVTAAGSDYVLTLTNSQLSATSIVMIDVGNGTNTTEGLSVNRVQPSSGSCIIRVRNTNASVALNGTILISGVVFN